MNFLKYIPVFVIFSTPASDSTETKEPEETKIEVEADDSKQLEKRDDTVPYRSKK